jgi:AcrR family transcriptional regulator
VSEPSETAGARPRPGRPRSEQAADAIRAAALALLAERELGAISMDEVAALAGSSKATIYRHWPSKEALVADALASLASTLPVPDTGTLRGDLRALLRDMVHTMTHTPAGRVLAMLVPAMQRNEELHHALMTVLFAPRRALLAGLVQRAIDRGEVPAGTDSRAIAHLVVGPVLMHVLITHEPIEDPFVETIVDTVVRGVGASEARGEAREATERAPGQASPRRRRGG